MKRVVVLGGGNGTSRLLRALLPLLQKGRIHSLHALVHTADDGGSTGRLRQQYDVGSMGDLTRCLMALSELQGDRRGEELLRALDYRFHNGDFQGHTLRNILLTVFELTSHDIDSAIAIMARLVQIPKEAGVVPTTLKATTQQVEIELNGRRSVLGEGEHFIAHKVNLQIDPEWKPGMVRVTFKEDYPLNPRATEVLEKATDIIVAPGHTFGSILPTLALPALGKAVAKSSAQLISVMTLLTTPRQTTGWSGEDFVRVYEMYLGRGFDAVIANTGRPKVELVPDQDWVTFREQRHTYQLLQTDVVNTEQQLQQAEDTVPRAVVVHDAEKMGKVFEKLLNRLPAKKRVRARAH